MVSVYDVIYIFLGIDVVFILVILWLKRIDILSFLFPDKWNTVIMLESDNNVSEWIQSKTPDLRFQFNDGFYNMYELSSKMDDRGIPMPIKDQTTVYRSGRLGCFIYIEGNENPVDLRNLRITGNPQLNRQIQKVDISKLFNSEETPLENIMKIALPILIFLGVVVVIIILLSKGNTQQVIQTVQPIQTIPGG